MYIKNIIISGFRSYREQSFPDELSPSINVLVGRNGSGKSNFFEAIQFVLSEKYTNLNTLTRRKELFHVGSGRPALSIFVEIVFDNSDGRCVIPGREEEKEVRIRRTLGLKQDEFRVNDRKFSAEDVRQLLESAGFSSANPYCIVEQGKIVRLASMSEVERYHLIKELAGTKKYDARRKESEEILSETKLKHEKIAENIKELEVRLKELEGESKELKEFQDADLKKRCVEYCIFSAELQHAKDSLARLEKEWNARQTSVRDEALAASANDEEIAHLEETLRDLVIKIKGQETEQASLEGEIESINKRLVMPEVEVSDVKTAQDRNAQEYAALSAEKEELVSMAEKTKKELTIKKKAFEEKQLTVASRSKGVEEMESNLSALQEKRGRQKLFKSQSERDKFILDEIQKNESVVLKNEAEVATAYAEVEKIKKLLATSAASKEVPQGDTDAEAVALAQKHRETEMGKHYANRDRLNAERRRIWQQVHEQEELINRLQDEQVSCKQRVERAIRFEIRQGWQSLQEVLKEMNNAEISSQVHGPLIDLFTYEDGYETAIDVTAGNALFNVVVDSFQTSTALLEKMNERRKPGRVSFFPMDTCGKSAVQLPSTPECSPLIDKLNFDKRFSGVFNEVFGRTLVVTTLEAGSKFGAEYRCDAVTLDGDQVARKGALTGGFLDKRNCKVSLYNKNKKVHERLHKEKERVDSLCSELSVVEHNITGILHALEELKTQKSASESKAEATLRASRFNEERRNRYLSQKDNLLNTISTLKRSSESVQKTITRLRAELQEIFTSKWTAAQEKEMEAIAATVSSGRNEVASLHASLVQVSTDVQVLEERIQHIERRIVTVGDRMREIQRKKSAAQGLEMEEASVATELKALGERVQKVRESTEDAVKERHKLEANIEMLKANRLTANVNNNAQSGNVDRVEVRRALLMQRRDDAVQKIRKMGPVPSGVDQFKGAPLSVLMSQLKSSNDVLKKYSQVNRRAVDQYSALMDTKNDLVSQQNALEKEQQSIYELIDSLDKKKGEAITLTYKQIQYEFEQVFKQLVDTEGSSAVLELIERENPDECDDPFEAARVRVSFGHGSAIAELEQLSGGQKSLVALAIIMAIQRCDPAPFYLFDEIDAALDSEYRENVARVIKKEKKCQFIIATFKTELVNVADSVLGIFFHNKVSRIQKITHDEGIKLLKQAAQDARKRTRDDA